MVNDLIQWSLRNRLAVLLISALVLALGAYTTVHMPVDVFPDLTAPTVTVIVEGHGMAPQEMETLITFPLETAVNGAAHVRRVRSATSVGIAVVWVEFEWGTDIYRARQTVAERLADVSGSLPEQVEPPVLAPVSSIMGEIGELQSIRLRPRARGHRGRRDPSARGHGAELRASQRNRAIAALLSGSGLVEDEQAALLLYLQQCCVTLDAVRLARMAAMLARGGVPSGRSDALVSPRAVRDTLSLMYTSGLHDGSGRFAFEVGFPAKSGISGALVAVVPGVMGLAAWSPAVDERGTSVRGAAALRALSRELDLALFATRPKRE